MGNMTGEEVQCTLLPIISMLSFECFRVFIHSIKDTIPQGYEKFAKQKRK